MASVVEESGLPPPSKRRKLKKDDGDAAVPHLVSPHVLSLFNDLTQVCVRNVAFQFDNILNSKLPDKEKDWEYIVTSKFEGSCAGRVIGLDVETVETLTSKRRLARLSAVELEWDGTTLESAQYHTAIDVFVEPGEEVVDYRSHVSGISPTVLDEARTAGTIKTFKQAQALLLGLCVADGAGDFNVVLVGHAISNDMKATKIVPRTKNRGFVDTAYLFNYDGVPFKSVGLKLAMKHVLGQQVQSGEHSSVEDAVSSLKLAVHEASLAKACLPSTPSIPLKLAPWHRTIQISNIPAAHHDMGVSCVKQVLADVFGRECTLGTDAWSESAQYGDDGKVKKYTMKLVFDDVDQVMKAWKKFGKDDPSVHIMIDSEGFWLKKVGMVQGLPKADPRCFYIRMYLHRANVSVAEQAERRKTGGNKLKSYSWGKTKIRLKDRQSKRGRRCVVCREFLKDDNYVKPVAPGSSRFMHTSATRCAKQLGLLE